MWAVQLWGVVSGPGRYSYGKDWWESEEKQWLSTINSYQKSSMNSFFIAVELSVWPVCLASFLSKLWKFCWKLMLLLLLFFFFSFFPFPPILSSSAHGCWQGRGFRWEQGSVQGNCSQSHLPWWGSVFVSCSASVVTAGWCILIQPLRTARASPWFWRHTPSQSMVLMTKRCGWVRVLIS